MELALKILAGIAVVQTTAMVLVVWLVCRRPAGILPQAQAKTLGSPALDQKPVAFFSGVGGVQAGIKK